MPLFLVTTLVGKVFAVWKLISPSVEVLEVLRKKFLLFFFSLSVSLVAGGCSFFPSEQPEQPFPVPMERLTEKPLSGQESKELLKEVGSNWAYGPGLGETILTAGTIAVYPPAGLFFLGNAAARFAGFDGMTVSETFGEEEAKTAEEVYEGLVSGPGRFSALIAGKEYRNREVARERVNSLLEEFDQARAIELPKPSFFPIESSLTRELSQRRSFSHE